MTKNEKYKIRDNKESICCSPNYGPYAKYFGCETSMNNIIHYFVQIYSYFENADDIPRENKGYNNYNYNNYETYNLEEVEVFEIFFEN